MLGKHATEENLRETHEQLEQQFHYLDFLYHLRNSLTHVRNPDQVIPLVGRALVEISPATTAINVAIEYDGRSWSFGQADQEHPFTYKHSLSWNDRKRGQLRLSCIRELSKLEERMLLDETAAQLAHVLEAQELSRQLLHSARQVSLGQMASGIAHELNQPLMAISATAEDVYLRLLDGLELTPQQLKEMMQDVLDMVERVNEIIEHMRVFARDGSQEPGSCFALNEVVHSALQLIQTQLKNHAIDLQLELAEGLPLVQGHSQQLEQMLLNLLTNARDALDAGEGKEKRLVVRTRGETQDGRSWVEMEVEDSGAGMEEETWERIFEPFFTTKPPDQGAGLGLSIAYAIVQNHEGELTCHSQKGQGATFRVRLPGVVGEEVQGV